MEQINSQSSKEDLFTEEFKYRSDASLTKVMPSAMGSSAQRTL